MNMLCTISQQKLTPWRQQGKAVKQWLGYFFSELDWLESYASQPDQCLNWIDAINVRLRETPLFGSCLTDITESLPQEQSVAKAHVNKRASSADDIRHARSVRFKQQDDRKKLKRSAALRMLDRRVKHRKSPESVSKARRIQTQASYAALRQWSNIQNPAYEVSDQADPVHSFPAELQRQKISRSSNAFRKISSVDDKEWASKPLHRVKRMLAEEKIKSNYSVDYTTVVPTTIKTKYIKKTKHIKAIKQGSLLAEQWKTVFRDQQISREVLMNIVAKTAHISPLDTNNKSDGVAVSKFKGKKFEGKKFEGKRERGTARLQSPNRTSVDAQRSGDRQHKSTPMTHGETQPEFQKSPAFQDVSFVQQTVTSPYQLNTVTNPAFENQLDATEKNPAEIEKNDEELTMQIKRILDDEARRYGIDV